MCPSYGQVMPRWHQWCMRATWRPKSRLGTWRYFQRKYRCTIWVFPKIWVPQRGKPHKNGWFGGTTIFGNTHITHTVDIVPASHKWCQLISVVYRTWHLTLVSWELQCDLQANPSFSAEWIRSCMAGPEIAGHIPWMTWSCFKHFTHRSFHTSWTIVWKIFLAFVIQLSILDIIRNDEKHDEASWTTMNHYEPLWNMMKQNHQPI